MLEFENFLDKMEAKRYCSLGTIGAVVGIVGGVTGVAKTLAGGGSGGATGGSSGGGGSSFSSPSYNAGSNPIVPQTPQTDQASVAAATYNPTQQMEKWSSIFSDMGQTKGSSEIQLPSYRQAITNIGATE